jgi:hypothetical protein
MHANRPPDTFSFKAAQWLKSLQTAAWAGMKNIVLLDL